MRLRTRAALRYAPSGLLRVRGIEDSPHPEVARQQPVLSLSKGRIEGPPDPRRRPFPRYCPTPRSFGHPSPGTAPASILLAWKM